MASRLVEKNKTQCHQCLADDWHKTRLKKPTRKTPGSNMQSGCLSPSVLSESLKNFNAHLTRGVVGPMAGCTLSKRSGPEASSASKGDRFERVGDMGAFDMDVTKRKHRNERDEEEQDNIAGHLWQTCEPAGANSNDGRVGNCLIHYSCTNVARNNMITCQSFKCDLRVGRVTKQRRIDF